MKYKFGSKIVIALGRSIIYPQNLNIQFLKKFFKLLKKYSRHRKFILVCGGGKIAREYQRGLEKLNNSISSLDKDLIGIYATRINALLLRLIFKNISWADIIDSRFKLKRLKAKINVASGWEPGGFSTDYVALALAKDFGIKEVIIAGQPDFVYHPDSKGKFIYPYNSLSWDEYQRLIPSKWHPGMNVPVDPVASRFAQKHKLSAIIVKGENIKNLDNLLDGREFRGTIIK